MRNTVATLLILAISELLFACGGGGGGSSSGSGGSPTGPVTLFEETFSTLGGGASTMTNNWIVGSGGSTCTASNTDQDVLGAPPQGNATPGLVLKCQGTIIAGDAGSLRSLATYVLNTPLTFAVDARVDTVGPFALGGMMFSLRELNSGFFVAYVSIRPDSVTYYMNSGGGFGDIQVTQNYPADALFHRYVFVINGSGNAEWRRDGILQASTTILSTTTGPVANTGNIYIKLTSPPSTTTEASNGHFDNVLVTAP